MRDDVWRTKDGREIPIKQMDDGHLMNAIEMLNKSFKKFEALINEAEKRGLIDWKK